MKQEIKIDLRHVNVTNLNTNEDFKRKAQQLLPDILTKIGEDLGRNAWEQLQKSFKNIRGLKVNNSLSEKNKFIRERGKEYRKNAQSKDCHMIEQQIIEKLKLKKELQQINQTATKELKMPYQATIYKVFIASPTDVKDERKIITAVIDDWNAINSENQSKVLLPIKWETHSYPEMGAHPQTLLNKQILRDADLLIGVFWSRIGTATEKYPSGTVEEIREHIDARKPTMLYFSKTNLPNNVDTQQLEELRNFKEWCNTKGLYREFESSEEFRSSLFNQLSQMLNRHSYFENTQIPMNFGVSNNDEAILSKEAEEMLRVACEHNEKIVNLRFLGGCIIGVNGKAPQLSGSDSRDIASREAALEELESKGFIDTKSHKREIFNITKKGYDWFDNNAVANPSGLSDLAKKYLVEAYQTNKDILFEDKTDAGIIIGVAGSEKLYDRNNNKREIAQHKAAIQELATNVLIEKSGEIFYTVTDKGYTLAEELLQ